MLIFSIISWLVLIGEIADPPDKGLREIVSFLQFRETLMIACITSKMFGMGGAVNGRDEGEWLFI